MIQHIKDIPFDKQKGLYLMNNTTGLLKKKKYQTIQVLQKGVFLGAEITGIDLSKPLTKKNIEEIADAHSIYGVLIFPNQYISSDDLQRFGRYFGKLSVHPFSTNTKGNPELIVFDNKEGNPPASTDVWHTDETFRERPPMGTALYSKIIPKRSENESKRLEKHSKNVPKIVSFPMGALPRIVWKCSHSYGI